VKSPKAPIPPDPVATANAQTGLNIDSGITTNMNNMTNQVTPDGSLNYAQTGSSTYVASNGKTYNIPQYTATETLSPTQQALYNTNNATQQEIGNIGLQQSQKIGALLDTPYTAPNAPGTPNLSDTSIDQDLYNLYSPRVQLQQGNTLNSLNSQLAAEGVTQGSQAYNNAMTLNSQANNDQWNQLYLTGHNTAIGQIQQNYQNQEQNYQDRLKAGLLTRQEPLNEISALMSGSQVTNPTFGQTPASTIAPADYLGAVQNNFQDQMQIYNQKVANNNAMMGGIFGTVGALGGAWMRSDRRLKTDIVWLGRLSNGLSVYSYRFVNDNRPDIGLMAQEVELVKPWAVREIGGTKYVNYEEAAA
jgi:hypothetical protein